MDNQPTQPVMDVTTPAPPTIPPPPAEPSHQTEEQPKPVEETKQTDHKLDDEKSDKPEAAKATVESKKPASTKPKNSVGLAIVATVVIVLGLAAIAAFAYLNQNS